MGLGVLDRPLALNVQHGPPDDDPRRLAVEVDIEPLQGADLAPPAPGGGDDAEHNGVLRVPGRSRPVEDPQDIDHDRRRGCPGGCRTW